MNWILACILLFISSVSLYLLVRKAQLDGVSNYLNNLASFSLPCIFYFILIVLQKTSFYISPQQIIILILMAFLFSYLGNVFSLISIKLAPNPGYSLIISKSYVVLTTLVAVVFLHQTLSLKNILAISLIIIFSGLITISSKKISKTKHNILWVIYSLGAFFAWGFLSISSKYLLNLGISVEVLLFYLCLFVTIFIALEIKVGKKSIVIKKENIIILVVIGVLSALFNLFMQLAFKTAPNIGYVNAVNASSISMVALFSAYFFKDELTFRKLIGIFGVTVSLILLFL